MVESLNRKKFVYAAHEIFARLSGFTQAMRNWNRAEKADEKSAAKPGREALFSLGENGECLENGSDPTA